MYCKKFRKVKNNIMKPVIIVHGGAGDIGEERVPGKINGVKLSAKVGFEILHKGGSALEAVEAAVRVMEDDEYFNAGKMLLLYLFFGLLNLKHIY